MSRQHLREKKEKFEKYKIINFFSRVGWGAGDWRFWKENGELCRGRMKEKYSLEI